MSKDAAMPTGVTIAGLGARVLVNILDLVPLAILSVLVSIIGAQSLPTTVTLVVGILAAVLALGWLVFLWWGYATRGQGPAAKWLRIRVLRLVDGRPVGWGRWFLRGLVWYASMIVPIVWLLLVIMMIVQPRRRGWHDLAGQSVVVQSKGPAAPAADARPVQRPAVASANMVSLPAHLMAPHAPYVPSDAPRQDAHTPQSAEPITSLPDFGGQAPAAAPSAFAPTPAAGSDVPWDEWGVQPPVQQTPYASQVPYNAPAAYLQQPPNPYASQQPAPYAQQSPASYAPQPDAYAPQPDRYAPQPQAAYAQAPQPSPSPQPMIVAEDDDLTRTHLAPVGKTPGPPRKATDGWQLRLDDGRTVPVHGLVLIGRSPQPQPDEHAELVQAGVESRMVSKTHLAIGLDHRGLYVMDRGSTNGTAIANSGGQFEPCAAGDPVRVREGQIVSFGDRYLEVRREV
jgi:uncharacterized RDD family membrane protein YckC